MLLFDDLSVQKCVENQRDICVVHVFQSEEIVCPAIKYTVESFKY